MVGQADKVIMVRPEIMRRKGMIFFGGIFALPGLISLCVLPFSSKSVSDILLGIAGSIIFIGAGLVIIIFVGGIRLSILRFWRARLTITSGPVRPGWGFAATVHLPDKFSREDHISVWLINEERMDEHDSEITKQHYVQKIKTTAEQTGRSDLIGSDGRAFRTINISATIPADSKDERHDGKDREGDHHFYWVVRVCSEMKGINLNMQFRLPTEGGRNANV